MLSENQVEQIREATNIVDLVSEHVRLKKRGRNFTGLCPFHNEKTPSFSVLEDKGIFKCFGCGKGGDVFSFVMQMEGLTFPEALQRLAKRANIEIEQTQTEEELKARNERDSLYDVLKAAATWYFRTLRTPEGGAAMDYLLKRGLEPETIRKFGLGFAPDRAGLLIKTLTDQGYSESGLENAGLITRRDGGEWFERFRGRAIFPVFSATGRIVGFGGRIMPGATHPAKYINSPDTQVYHKSQILYGLFQAKDAIRRKGFSVLVEGYADVLAVFQGGVENVVAASGTSLTVEQLQLLKRYTTTVVLLFDADTAGKNAAIRGIELAIEAGFDVNTVVLPAGEDPDSFIRSNGREAFETALEHRQSWIETKAQWFEEHGEFNEPGRMAVAIRSIVETIAKVPDAIKRPLFIQKLGDRFHLSEQMLSIELQKFLQSREARERNAPPPQQEITEGFPEERGGDTEIFHETVPKEEAVLLEAAIADPVGVTQVIDNTGFDLNSISNHIAREIISFIMQQTEAGEPPEVAALYAEYRERPEYGKVLADHSMMEFALSDNWDEDSTTAKSMAVHKAQDAIASLGASKASAHLSRTQERLKSATSDEELHALLQEATSLAQRRLRVQPENRAEAAEPYT